MTLHERPPARAEANAVTIDRRPCCSACERPLARDDQWRCPYVTCRAWLRGSDDERQQQVAS